MKCNIGGADRVERIVGGIVLILIGIFLVRDVWQYIVGIYGLVKLLTGVFAWCPLYTPFKHTSRHKA